MMAYKMLLLAWIALVGLGWGVTVTCEDVRQEIKSLPQKTRQLTEELETILGMRAAPVGRKRDSHEELWNILPPKYMLDLYQKYADDSYILESNPDLTHTIRCVLGTVKRDSIQFNLSGIHSGKSVSHAEVHMYRRVSRKRGSRRKVMSSHPRIRLRNMPKKYLSTIISLLPARGWQVVDITGTVKSSMGKGKVLTMTVEGSIPEFGTGRARYHTIPVDEALRVAYRPFLVIFSSTEPVHTSLIPSSTTMSSAFGGARDLGRLYDRDDDDDEDDEEDEDDDEEDKTLLERWDSKDFLKWNEGGSATTTTNPRMPAASPPSSSDLQKTRKEWSKGKSNREPVKTAGYGEDNGESGGFGGDSFDELENSLQSILNMDRIPGETEERGEGTGGMENNEISSSNSIRNGRRDDNVDRGDDDEGSIIGGRNWGGKSTGGDGEQWRNDGTGSNSIMDTHFHLPSERSLSNGKGAGQISLINHSHSKGKRSIKNNEFIDEDSREISSLSQGWRRQREREGILVAPEENIGRRKNEKSIKKIGADAEDYPIVGGFLPANSREKQILPRDSVISSSSGGGGGGLGSSDGDVGRIGTGGGGDRDGIGFLLSQDNLDNQLLPPVQREGMDRGSGKGKKNKKRKRKGKEEEVVGEENTLPFPSRHHPWWNYKPDKAKENSATGTQTDRRKQGGIINFKKKKNQLRRNHRHHLRKNYDQPAAEIYKTAPTFAYNFIGEERMKAERSESSCRLRKESVEVSVLDWTDRIIAPAVLPLNYCDGPCYDRADFHEKEEEGEEKKERNLVHYDPEEQKFGTTGPCCNASGKSRLVLLFADPHDNIVLRIYPNVTTMGCQCF